MNGGGGSRGGRKRGSSRQRETQIDGEEGGGRQYRERKTEVRWEERRMKGGRM